jgi:hypothetical protein
MRKPFILAFLFLVINYLSYSQNLNAFKILFEEGDKQVLFYGSAHDNNILNPMFADIEDSFLNFMPEAVLVEGGYNNRIFNSKEQAIENGEMAFVTYLASINSTPIYDIEPPITFVDSILMNHFSHNLIFTMYILRQTYQYQVHSMHNDIDFIKEIESYAKSFVNNEKFEFEGHLSFEDIYGIIEVETDIAITRDNWFDKTIEVRRYMYNRAREIKNPVQIVHSMVVDIRDEYAISLIMCKLENKNRVFVIMGNQHLKNQEKRLREELKNLYSH